MNPLAGGMKHAQSGQALEVSSDEAIYTTQELRQLRRMIDNIKSGITEPMHGSFSGIAGILYYFYWSSSSALIPLKRIRPLHRWLVYCPYHG